MSDEWPESDLQRLADFICGRGEFAVFGTGITTYPSEDDNSRAKHRGCEELERRGVIARTGQSEDGRSVYWKPT